jgi:hypothetical protein
VASVAEGYRGTRFHLRWKANSMAELPIDVVLGYIEDLTDGKSAAAF